MERKLIMYVSGVSKPPRYFYGELYTEKSTSETYYLHEGTSWEFVGDKIYRNLTQRKFWRQIIVGALPSNSITIVDITNEERIRLEKILPSV